MNDSRDAGTVWTPAVLSLVGGTFLADAATIGAMFALSWEVLVTTGSPGKMSVLLIGEAIAAFVAAGPVGGVIDRVEPRRLFVWAQLVRAVLAIAVPILAALGQLGFAAIAILATLLGVGRALHEAVKLTVIPSLVGGHPARLDKVNTALRFVSQAGLMAAPAAVGLVFELLTMPTVLGICALSFALAAIALGAGVKLPGLGAPPLPGDGRDGLAPRPRPPSRPKVGMLAGVVAIRERPILLSTVAVCLVMATVIPVLVVQWLPIFVNGHLQGDAPMLGWARGVAGGAGLAGTVLYGIFAPRIRRGRGLGIGIAHLFFLTFLVVLAEVPTYFVLLVILVLVDVIGGAMRVATQTLLIAGTPPELRGRVFATFGGLISLGTPLGFGLAAITLSAFGWRPVLLGLAVAGGLAGLAFLIPKESRAA